jgi:hypothetical protein
MVLGGGFDRGEVVGLHKEKRIVGINYYVKLGKIQIL